ncbi:MAG TPA: type IV pilus secretin PilQ [Polyangiaceae bacterium]|nr:type IV pilus secretin PilQ [Polyangiaceae bacterium]
MRLAVPIQIESKRLASSALALLLALSLAHPAAAAEPLRHATKLTVAPESAGETRIRIQFSAAPTFTARLEQQGVRLIVDVPNADLVNVPAALTERVGMVTGVLTQTFKPPGATGSSTLRVLVMLSEPAKYAVIADGNDLVLRFASGELPPLSADRATVPAASAALPRVSDVKYEHTSDSDRIRIELSERVEYSVSEPDPSRARLTLRGSLPEELERRLDVSAFHGKVSAVSSFAGEAQQVVFEVERAPGVKGRVERRGTALDWIFDAASPLPSTVSGVGADGKAARRVKTVHVESPTAGIAEVHTGFEGQAIETRSNPDEAHAFGASVLGQQRKAYTGRRIDLDLKDADVHNVLRLLADVGQVNIVTADNVSGTITIRMRNVPWDQALDIVLQAKSLGMVRQANMIRVAPLDVLEKEREMQIARRQQEVKLAPIETRLVPISYANAEDLQERARPLLSERGSLAVDERTNVLIARDLAGNLNQIEELVRSLDTQTPQVLVEARIVEATSRYLRDVGIQWGGDATFSGATGNPTGLAFPNSVGVVGGASDAQTPTAGLSPFANSVSNPNFAVNLPAAVGTGQGGAIGLTFGSIDNNFNLALRLSAAEASGMLRILSSPRVLTLDNQQARISQGTLIPFSQVSAQGVQTTFQEAKLQLLVRPHVTADGSISMHVKINRDEPDFNQTSARGDPTILKREAETHLLVMDGHTAVIGGIYTRNTGRNLDQVPFFGDIPLLGLLFQRRRASDSRSELVIFLTPRIVNRAEALGR